MFTVVSPSSSCSSPAPGEAIIDVQSSSEHTGSGLLSSQVTELTGCGTADWPWLIKAGDGQRVNITLHDFSHDALATRSRTSGAASDARTCKVYATIRDGSGSRSTTICGGRAPVTHVFLSTTSRVEIRLLQPAAANINSKVKPKVNAKSHEARMPYFLLRYQGPNLGLILTFLLTIFQACI